MTVGVRRPATVYLVGAGPGDPALITLKGAGLLREADVVVYDRLIPEELLGLARERAELVPVGKAPGRPGFSQEEINALLYREASSGRMVVRLKGGDPLLFGRGGEEAEYLAQRGVRVEIVPGITSAIAAPAYAGIPVTHRGVSRSVAIATGHTLDDEDAVDWGGVARACDTVIVLMGRGNLGCIVERMMESGMEAATPAAAVYCGTTWAQRTVVSSLGTLERAVAEAGLEAPLVVVVGEVTAMREKILWWERSPLFGKRVLLLRARGQEVTLSARLASLGAKVIHVPALEIRGREADPAAERALRRIAECDWVVFTSPNAVSFLFAMMREKGMDSRRFAAARIAALGPGTGNALEARGLVPDLVPSTHSVEGLMRELEEMELSGLRFLLVRSALAPPDLRFFLRRRGARVNEIHPYQVEIAREMDEGLMRRFERREIDMVLLTSPSTVFGLLALVGGDARVTAGAAVGCIGPTTADAAAEAGLNVDFTAEKHCEEGLIEAVLRFAEVRSGG